MSFKEVSDWVAGQPNSQTVAEVALRLAGEAYCEVDAIREQLRDALLDSRAARAEAVAAQQAIKGIVGALRGAKFKGLDIDISAIRIPPSPIPPASDALLPSRSATPSPALFSGTGGGAGRNSSDRQPVSSLLTTPFQSSPLSFLPIRPPSKDLSRNQIIPAADSEDRIEDVQPMDVDRPIAGSEAQTNGQMVSNRPSPPPEPRNTGDSGTAEGLSKDMEGPPRDHSRPPTEAQPPTNGFKDATMTDAGAACAGSTKARIDASKAHLPADGEQDAPMEDAGADFAGTTKDTTDSGTGVPTEAMGTATPLIIALFTFVYTLRGTIPTTPSRLT
ncbi:hypothetical protein OF83DRAFT_1089747, partial [Amylostereum chailletii]